MAFDIGAFLKSIPSLANTIGGQFKALTELPAQNKRAAQAAVTAKTVQTRVEAKTPPQTPQNFYTGLAIANSTPAIIPFGPSQPTRIPYGTAKQTVQLGVSNIYPLNVATEFAFRTPEFLTRAVVEASAGIKDLLNQVQQKPLTGVTVAVKKERLGYAPGGDPYKVESAQKRFGDAFNKANAENLPVNRTELLKNFSKAFVHEVLPTIADIAFAGDFAAHAIPAALLKYSQYDPILDQFLVRNGLTRQDLQSAFRSGNTTKLKDAFNRTVKAAYAEGGDAFANQVVQYWDRTGAYILKTYPDINVSAPTNPSVIKFQTAMQRAGEVLSNPIENLTGTRLPKNVPPIAPAEGMLPGYRAVNPNMRPAGLSTEPVERVGGVPEISKELQPFAQEARKYGLDFSRVKSGYEKEAIQQLEFRKAEAERLKSPDYNEQIAKEYKETEARRKEGITFREHKDVFLSSISKEPQPLVQEIKRPFSIQEQSGFNSFTHYPKDFNKEYENIVSPIRKKVETIFGKDVPDELRVLLDEHSKRAEQYLRAEGERMIKAPSPSVVGPANYNVSKTSKANRAFEKKTEQFNKFERQLESKINQLAKVKDRAEFSALSETDQLKENIASVEKQIARMNFTRDNFFIEKMTKQKLSLEKKLTKLQEVKPEIIVPGPREKVLPERISLPIRQQFVRPLPLEELYSITPEVVKGKEIPPTKRPPSLEKLGLRERPEMITRREDVLLRARIRNEARGAKFGAIEARRLTRQELIAKFKDSRENVRQIKSDLIKYIDENLPQEAKGKLTQSLVRDNLTRKNAASIFSRVERMKETLTRKELVGEIKELSVPKGNLAVDYQKQVSETIAGIDLIKPTEKTLKKLRGLKDFIQREGVPLNIQSKYIERLDRLTKKPASELSTAELTELKDTLNQLQNLGKLKQDLKYKYHERERRVALDKLLASTQNIDPKVSGLQTKLDTYKVGTKKVYMDTLHTPRVADMIDGFKGYRGENAKLIKGLGRKETEAKINTNTIVNSALEEIQNLGIEELTEDQQLRMMINIRYREGAFDQVKTLLEKSGLKEVPELTNQENAVIEILKKYTNQFTDDIAAVFEEIENQPFHKLKEYILPIKYEKEFNLIPSQTIEQGRFRTTQTYKGFTYERQKGVEKIPRTDILAIFEEAINAQQWYLNMQPELENIKYLVKSEEYLVKGGEMASNWWKTELDVVARRGWSATARSNPVLRQTRINLNQAILGYKISSILMQPFAVFDAMAYAQSRYGTMATLRILKEFAKAWIIPKYAKDFISESPALQLRQAGELAIEETLKKVGKTRGLMNSFIRGGMSLLQKADVITAAGIEKGLLRVLEEADIPNAKEEAEFLMNMVSGSNEVVYRPHILASGEGARTWFTFQTFFLNRWGIVIHDLIRSGVIKGGGEAGWKGLWKRMSALIGLGIFIAGSIAENQSRKAIYETTTGKKLPDQSMLKDAVMFIPEQVPYFGNLLEAADRGGDANPAVIRTVENIFSGGASVIKGVKPETKIRGGLRMAEAGISLTTGIPGTAQFFDLLERIFLGGEKKAGLGQSNYADSILLKYGISSQNVGASSILEKYGIK